MFGAILAPPANVRLDHIAPVEKRHLAVGLDPYLVARVRRDYVQRRHVQPELARLGELAQAGPKREQIRPRDRRGQVGERQRHIVDARRVQPEDVSTGRGRVVVIAGGGRGSDEVREGAASVIGEFREEGLRLRLSEWSHFEVAKKRKRGGG